MNDEIEEIVQKINTLKSAITEIDMMIADYHVCQSETSKKYLAAAVKKQTGQLMPQSQASK